MERLVNSLRVRMLGVVLVILTALVPLLYVGVLKIVRDGYTERFVNSVRTYSRLIADELESLDSADFERRAVATLDRAVLSGQIVYAEVRDGTHTLHSSIATMPLNVPARDDFHFGDQGDRAYFITHTLNRGDHSASLRLGFDETPTRERVAAAERQVLLAVALFVAASIAVAVWLSSVIARPMVRLQQAAQRVASGDTSAQLRVSSSIREIQELNFHLEHMRGELVGTAARLSLEMREREASEQKRLDLERRLLHRERIATIGTLAASWPITSSASSSQRTAPAAWCCASSPSAGRLSHSSRRSFRCVRRWRRRWRSCARSCPPTSRSCSWLRMRRCRCWETPASYTRS